MEYILHYYYHIFRQLSQISLGIKKAFDCGLCFVCHENNKIGYEITIDERQLKDSKEISFQYLRSKAKRHESMKKCWVELHFVMLFIKRHFRG